MSSEASTWVPAFEGQRPPFAPGNQVAAKHGAYARLRLSDAAAETADELRPLLVVYSEADEPSLQAFGLVLEQMKAAAGALEGAESRKEKLRLSQDARGCALAALRYAESFGLTPRSRVALGLDLVRGQQATLTLTRLAAMADDEAAA